MADRVERRLCGTGSLILPDGQEFSIGAFRIEQSYSGRTFLYAPKTERLSVCVALLKPIGLQGQTSAGSPIKANWGALDYIQEPQEICIIVRDVEVGQRSDNASIHSLSITNFEFSADRCSSTLIDVDWGGCHILVRLTPNRNYQSRLRYLMKTEGVAPTAVLRFTSRNIPDRQVDEFVTDLCLALSVVQGRKINWIYHATYDSRRAFQRAIFGRTITKPHKVPPLCLNPTRRFRTFPLSAVRDAVPAIKRFRETFDPHHRLINAWLDGRTETDYLEARTLKSVVVVEALVALTARGDRSVETIVHPKASWKGLYRKIAAAMPEAFADAVTLANWNRLNDKPFRALLSETCKRHGIEVSKEDIVVFSRIRNSIIHRFDYDPEIRVPAEWDLPEQRYAALHFFAATFVDRIVLQLCALPTSSITASER